MGPAPNIHLRSCCRICRSNTGTKTLHDKKHDRRRKETLPSPAKNEDRWSRVSASCPIAGYAHADVASRNINVFGLSFIIAFSCVIVLLDFTILKILIFIGRFRRGSPRVNRWIQDGALQLQRRAHEAAGQGAWTQLEESNPVTTTGELLDELPLSSQHTCCVPSHPKEGTLPELIGLSTSSTVVTTVNQQSPTNSVSSGTDASAPNEVLPSHAIAQTGENMHQVEQPPPASTPNTSGGIKTSPRVSG